MWWIYAKAFPIEHWGIDWTAENATDYLQDFFEQKRFVGYVYEEVFYQHLESFDILYIHKLHEHPWGQRVVRFYDPDGHIIEAAEKLDAVIARFVAQGLSPEETANRMGIPLDFVVSSLNVAK